MSYYKGKSIAVTGGAGFLGKHLVKMLQEAGAVVHVPWRQYHDLRKPNHVRLWMQSCRHVDVLFHLAARVGGIGATAAQPAQFFYDNAMMGLNVIDEAHMQGVGKVVVVGSVCAYPLHAPMPLSEDDLWEGKWNWPKASSARLNGGERNNEFRFDKS